MPCSHLSGCIQASNSIPALQMKMRERAVKKPHHLVRCVRVRFRVARRVFIVLLILRCGDELRGQKTIEKREGGEGGQSKPLNLSAICARILYTHVMSILAQLLGQGSAGLGPGPFSRDHPPSTPAPHPLPPPSPPPSPFLCSLWTQSETTRLHNSSPNLHFAITIMKSTVCR